MPHRYSFLGTRALVGALSFMVHCGPATAQGASPPPAVSVTPVVSRQVTETGEFIGRVTAIDKVDIVARVPGFIEERTFTEGQQVKKGDLLFRIEQATYKAAVESAAPTWPRRRRLRSTQSFSWSAAKSLCAIRPSHKPRSISAPRTRRQRRLT